MIYDDNDNYSTREESEVANRLQGKEWQSL